MDIDEFYRPDELRATLDLLARHPDITAVSFNVLPFWGGMGYVSRRLATGGAAACSSTACSSGGPGTAT